MTLTADKSLQEWLSLFTLQIQLQGELYALDRTEYWLLDLDPEADLVLNSAQRMRRNKRMPSIFSGFSDTAPRFNDNLERNSKHLQLSVHIII